MPEYRIKNWDKHFENNRTRELKRLDWVPIPNKMDGDGYTDLVDHPNAAAHLGAWLAIVEIASRQDPRGTLPVGRHGLAKTLSRISRLPVELFEEAIPRLIGEVGWLEEVPEPVPSQDDAGTSQDDAPRVRALREGKGMEGNGREGNTAPAPDREPTPISQPSELGTEGWEELVEVATRAGMSLDADRGSDLCQKVWRYRDFENRQNCIQGILERIKCGQYSQAEAEYSPGLRKYVEKNLWRETLRPRNRGQPNKKPASRAAGYRNELKKLRGEEEEIRT
jgi:hypothetical protein